MRQLIFTIFVFTNIVGGIEIASDIGDVWLDAGVAVDVGENAVGALDGDSDPLAESECDHCCHGGAHFAGFAVARSLSAFNRALLQTPFQASFYRHAIGAPPTPPPNV